MRVTRITRLLLAAVTALLALAPVAALAVEPTHETVHLTRVMPRYRQCDGFTIRGDFDVTRQITTFYDSDGTPIRQIIHVDIGGTVTNTATGYTLEAGGVRVFHVDLLTGQYYTTGSATLIHLPGGGVFNPFPGNSLYDANDNLVEYTSPKADRETQELCQAMS